MLRHSREKTVGRWRRGTFVVWVALTVIAAAYIMLAQPFAPYFREDLWVVGVIVPPLMIVLLAIGIAWLVWLVTSSRRRKDHSTAVESSGAGDRIADRP